VSRRQFVAADEFHWVTVNGQPGAYIVRDGAPLLLTVLGWRDGQVAEAISILNPDKLLGGFLEHGRPRGRVVYGWSVVTAPARRVAASTRDAQTGGPRHWICEIAPLA
jgi:hypothetical protein